MPELVEWVMIKTHLSVSSARTLTTEHFTQALDRAAACRPERLIVLCPIKNNREVCLDDNKMHIKRQSRSQQSRHPVERTILFGVDVSKNSPAYLMRVNICRCRTCRRPGSGEEVTVRRANESTRQAMRQNAKYGLLRAIIALVVASLATLLTPLAATAKSYYCERRPSGSCR